MATEVPQHGEIWLATTPGTELERFSPKSARPVLVAYVLDDVAFVYPITSQAAQKKNGLLSLVTDPPARMTLVVQHGLFKIALTALSPQSTICRNFGSLRERIQRDLEQREIRASGSSGPLQQNPFASLKNLKQTEQRPAKAARQEEAKDPFAEYLEKHLDDDMRHAGFDGRPRRRDRD